MPLAPYPPSCRSRLAFIGVLRQPSQHLLRPWVRQQDAAQVVEQQHAFGHAAHHLRQLLRLVLQLKPAAAPAPARAACAQSRPAPRPRAAECCPPLHARFRPGHGIAARVPGPVSDVGNCLRAPKCCFAQPQRFLRLFALGHIVHDSVVELAVAPAANQSRQAWYPPSQAF